MSRNFELLQQLSGEPRTASAPDFHVAAANSAQSRGERRNATALSLDPQVRSEYLKLVQRLFLELRVVVFAGVDEGNGSSTICGSVAEILAHDGRGSACVLNANPASAFWPPSVTGTNHLGLNHDRLDARPLRDFAQRLQPEDFWLVSCGSLTTDAPAHLKSAQLKSLFVQLREEFDFLIVDVPPVLLDTTAVLLAPLTEGVVLVVEASSTRREVARKAKETLESSNVRLLGAVLNNRTFPIPDFLYRRL
jgi:Mrp family chromosome partitioning ATPase